MFKTNNVGEIILIFAVSEQLQPKFQYRLLHLLGMLHTLRTGRLLHIGTGRRDLRINMSKVL